MTRQFEQYSAYAPVPTTVTATTWGGRLAINLKCLGCKRHFLYGTASMCSCTSRTLVRTEHGDECASYCPKEEETNDNRTTGALADYYRWKSAKGLTPEQHTQWNMELHRLLDEKQQRITDLERRMVELDGGECKIMATSTDNLMYPDRMTKCYELSCGHSVALKGGEPPRVCPICEKKVKR